MDTSKKGFAMQKPDVKRSSAEVNITSKGKSPVKISNATPASIGLPDADELARKYGVEAEEAFGNSGRVGSGNNDMGLTLAQQMEFVQKQQQLVQKLESKNQEIDRLCTLLEALEPGPGMDPEKYRRLLENPNADIVDFRDAKIVDLAKKSRKLQMLLTKERSLNDEKESKLTEAKQTIEKLRKELENTVPNMASSSSRVIRAVNTEDKEEMEMHAKEAIANATSNLQRDLALNSKKLEDLRRKYDVMEEQNKALSRALIKEEGEGVTLEEAVDEGRKGRAQTIVLLKAKIKRLEAIATAAGGAAASAMTMDGSDSTSISMLSGTAVGTLAGTAIGTAKSRLPRVDEQAEQELGYMHSVRKVAVDELSDAHTKLSEEYTALLAKHQGAKSRIRTLEADSVQHKQQLKTVISKTETDDALIQALKEEVTRLRNELQRRTLERRDDAVEVKIERASKAAAAVATQHQDAELARLRRLTKQQADQLATQDGIIRELRSKQKSY